MKNLADLLVDVLCHMTFEPEGGHDPEDTVDLQTYAWQTILNDLDLNEERAVKQAVEHKLAAMPESDDLTPEQEKQLAMLKACLLYTSDAADD